MLQQIKHGNGCLILTQILLISMEKIWNKRTSCPCILMVTLIWSNNINLARQLLANHLLMAQMPNWQVCEASCNNWLFAAPLLTTDHQHIRYVGVTGFNLHVLQPLPVRCTERNLCFISKSMMKYEQKSGFSWFGYVIENAWLLFH